MKINDFLKGIANTLTLFIKKGSMLSNVVLLQSVTAIFYERYKSNYDSYVDKILANINEQMEIPNEPEINPYDYFTSLLNDSQGESSEQSAEEGNPRQIL